MKQQTQDQPGKPPKIQIVEYHHDLLRDDCITAYTANGGRIILFTAEVDPKYHIPTADYMSTIGGTSST